MTEPRTAQQDGEATDATPRRVDRTVRAAIWLPGLTVAAAAAVATAHGLFEVAVAARVPDGIAWLYPLITDGLALVAYAATARLCGAPARYAWSVVVLAAGLSGLAQAAYLAGGATLDASPELRFGVGAWPAIAAAVVAHLLYLLAEAEPRAPATRATAPELDEPAPPAGPALPSSPSDESVSGRTATASDAAAASDSPDDRSAKPAGPTGHEEPVSGRRDAATGTASDRTPDSPVRDRARTAAIRHVTRYGALPTVRQLMDLAEVSRGTAADALKTLRQQPAPLHLVPDSPEPETKP